MENQTFFTKLEISEKVVNQVQGDNISAICEIQRLICRHFLSLFDCAAKRERKPRQEKKEKNTRTKGQLGQRFALSSARLRREFCVLRILALTALAGPMILASHSNRKSL